MTKNRLEKISLYLQCYVSKFFALYVNKEYQGKNFSWSNFPDMAKDYCLTNMWVASGLYLTSKNRNEDMKYIEKESVLIAEELIKLAGLKDEK
jgi:hypothetical protein